MIDLSIIVPVYNVESYLKQCIESIIEINEFSYELFLIDDGSTDNSAAICDEYANVDNIYIVHKKNEGVSAARNVGIKLARGKYLTFVDSDDFIDAKSLSVMMENLRGEDIAVSGFNYFYPDNSKVSNCLTNDVNNSDFRNSINDIYDEWESKCVFYAIYGKIYSNKIIKENSILFDESFSILEDSIFVWKYLKYCKTIITVKCSYYNYRQTSGMSLVKKYNSNAMMALAKKYYCSSWVLPYLQHDNTKRYYEDLFNKIIEYVVAIYRNEKYKEAVEQIFSELNLPGIVEIRKETNLSLIHPFKRKLLYWVVKKGYVNLFLVLNRIKDFEK